MFRPKTMTQHRWRQRSSDLRKRASVEIGPTGPKIAFAASALKLVDDVLIDFKGRGVLYQEYEFELPGRVHNSLGAMRKQCTQVQQQLAGRVPPLAQPFDDIEQACGFFQSRLSVKADIGASGPTPIPKETIEGLRQLRLEIAEMAESLVCDLSGRRSDSATSGDR